MIDLTYNVFAMKREDIRKLLKGKKLWVTDNRMKIIDCLTDNYHFHSITEILKHTKRLNTKSVYNSIKTLMEAGVVESYSFDGISKYAINDELIGLKNNIHLIINNKEVEHLSIDGKIFEQIHHELEKISKKAKSIKIFVHIDK